MKLIVIFLAVLALLTGCGINPVTGDRELVLVSENQEIDVGRQNYEPSIQMQGGSYALDPDLTRYVAGVGKRLAKVSDRQLPYEFVVLNNSVPNAWALPGGKIAVNRGLLTELHNEAELAAVLGHEIVHAVARHGAKSMERGLLLQGAILATGIAMQGKNVADYVVGGAQIAANLIHLKYGRDAELEADHYGMLYMARAGYEPIAAVGLQETFVRLAKGKESSWLAGLFASHPPSEERVEANRQTAARLRVVGGELGATRYQQAVAYLLEAKEAYADFDKGEKALAAGDLAGAHALAAKAVAKEPREGHFYALLGDVDFKQGRFEDALRDYDLAVRQPGDYYYFFLQRGLVHDKLGNQQDAAADLEASVKLLPTANAYNALGNIEEARGNITQAKKYFQAAAASSAEPGRQALQSLVRLDLPANPAAYIGVVSGLDQEGYLVVELENRTLLAIGAIVLELDYPSGSAMMRQVSLSVPGPIAAGKTIRLATGLGPLASQAALRAVRVAVRGAQVMEQDP